MKPEKLAGELGVTGKTLRSWLRETFPRSATEKHQRWELTQRQEDAARSRFTVRRLRADSRSGMVVTTMALPVRDHARLAAVAEKERTVLTELVRRAVGEWLERYSKAGKGAR